MHIINDKKPRRHSGVTLIELMVFLVVVGVALTGLLSVFDHSVTNSVDPIVRVRLLELAQSQLDEVLMRKYDENSPTGGIPACVPMGGPPTCQGPGLEAGEDLDDADTLDDVDDFDGYTDTPYTSPDYIREVDITENTGDDLGLPPPQAKLITVTVTAPGGEKLKLSVYRTNF